MDLFVYGTLQIESLMSAVAGGNLLPVIQGTVADFAVFQLPDHVVPMIVSQVGARAAGCIYPDLTAQQVARLDLFEGAFGYTRNTVDVETSDGKRQAQMYLPPCSQHASGKPWCLKEWEADHLHPTIFAVEELFSHDPFPSPAELLRMWPVIEKRAWGKHRAIQTGAMPASLRFSGKPTDAKVSNPSPPRGTFFRLQNFEVTHRRFDGTQSDTLNREVFMGVDAALVLPYDPKAGTVLLVEQFRMGPLRRGDPNPWQLEPIAGMTDARETPEDAARREAFEEANIVVDQLDFMFATYPSPGCSTDYFACFCTPCDLPEKESYYGGLEEESEDLRIHIVPLSKALNLIDSGEINAGPLVSMLYWLDRNKERYRATA